MKNNHIPRNERLQNRIWKLSLRLDTCMGRRRGNPYSYCTECGATVIDISINGDHHSGCSMKGLRKQIAHYEQLLG